CIFFFFQAEDGIRDRNVTGVQTCALPISLIRALEYVGAVIVPLNHRLTPTELRYQLQDSGASLVVFNDRFTANAQEAATPAQVKIGRASCRGSRETKGEAVALIAARVVAM